MVEERITRVKRNCDYCKLQMMNIAHTEVIHHEEQKRLLFCSEMCFDSYYGIGAMQ